MNNKYENLKVTYEKQKNYNKQNSKDSDNDNLKGKEIEILSKQKEINQIIIFLQNMEIQLYEEEEKIEKKKKK